MIRFFSFPLFHDYYFVCVYLTTMLVGSCVFFLVGVVFANTGRLCVMTHSRYKLFARLDLF